METLENESINNFVVRKWHNLKESTGFDIAIKAKEIEDFIRKTRIEVR